MPPYEDAIDEGKEIYDGNKALKKCFPNPAIMGEYPKFDEKLKEVVTITEAINSCLKESGKKPWNEKKGKIQRLKLTSLLPQEKLKRKLILKFSLKRQWRLMREVKKSITPKEAILNSLVLPVMFKEQVKG